MNILTGMKKAIESTLDQHSLSKICPSCQGGCSSAKDCDICGGMGKVSRKDMAMFNDVNLRPILIKRNKINQLDLFRQQIKEKDEKILRKIHQSNEKKCLTKYFKIELIDDLMLKTSCMKEFDFYFEQNDDFSNFYYMDRPTFNKYQLLKIELVSFVERKLIARNSLLSEISNIPKVITLEETLEMKTAFRKKFVAEEQSIKSMLSTLCVYDF